MVCIECFIACGVGLLGLETRPCHSGFQLSFFQDLWSLLPSCNSISPFCCKSRYQLEVISKVADLPTSESSLSLLFFSFYQCTLQ